MRRKIVSLGKGAVIAGVGATLAYLAEMAAKGEAGVYGPLATAVLSVAVNALRQAAKPEAK